MMARIPTVAGDSAVPEVGLIYRFTRAGVAELTGREIDGMIEPLELYAHLPALLRAYVTLEQATETLNHLDKRLRLLAELKAATLTHCEYCIDIGSQIARRHGLSDDELLALPHYQSSPHFSDVEKLVLDYAAGMSRTPVEVPDALFERLRAHFTTAEIVELTHAIALENMRGRFNLALGVGAAGFSEGMVCAVPAAAAG